MQVVHIKKAPRYDIYIGRTGAFIIGQWSNPYIIGEYHNGQLITRSLSIQLYEIYIRNRLDTEPELVEELLAMGDDAILGCWCVDPPVNYIRKKKECHGEIIMELYQEYQEQNIDV